MPPLNADLEQRIRRLENQILALSHALRQTNTVFIEHIDGNTDDHSTKMRLLAISESIKGLRRSN